jgi:hypothetical protein
MRLPIRIAWSEAAERKIPMSIRMPVWLIALAAIAHSLGCSGKPEMKYQTGQVNVAAGQAEEWNFDKDVPGSLPAGAEIFSGAWAVQSEADAPSAPHVLCQSATADFPALSLGPKVYGNLVMSIRFKPISGKTDQAAGILFRIQDANNYYILRANALEDNVIFFRYASGKRTTLQEGSAKVPSGQWQDLRLEAAGNRFRGFLNDQRVVETTDDAYQAGQVGLWTKADSVTCFDDVKVTAK